MYRINKLVVKVFVPNNHNIPIDPHEIKRILILRPNYRIGNILFLTPLIKALDKKIPESRVDLLIGNKLVVPVIKAMDKVDNVYDVPRNIYTHPVQLIRKFRKINKNNYQLVITTVSMSTTSNIMLLFLKAKYKLGFYNKDSWCPVNRTVSPDEKVKHEALIPLLLMAGFAGKSMKYDPVLDIGISGAERTEGKKVLSRLLAENQITGEPSFFAGIFRDARFNKKIADEWWLQLVNKLKRLDKNLIIVDIVDPSGEAGTISQDVLSISFENLRKLAQFISVLDIFICGDTGPLHLASASKTPVVALFNVTDPVRYGPLGKEDQVVDVHETDVHEVSGIVYDKLKAMRKD